MNRAGWKKDLVSGKRARAKRTRKLKTNERLEKAKVRLRDKVCRFPVCGCQDRRTSAMKAIPTCSHDVHKGMGGDPTGACSVSSMILLLCKWRHQDAPCSRHAGTMKTEYLTADQNNGPLAFSVDLSALRPSSDRRQLPQGTWFEVARETAPGVLADLTDVQREILGQLAEMTR